MLFKVQTNYNHFAPTTNSQGWVARLISLEKKYFFWSISLVYSSEEVDEPLSNSLGCVN